MIAASVDLDRRTGLEKRTDLTVAADISSWEVGACLRYDSCIRQFCILIVCNQAQHTKMVYALKIQTYSLGRRLLVQWNFLESFCLSDVSCRFWSSELLFSSRYDYYEKNGIHLVWIYSISSSFLVALLLF